MRDNSGKRQQPKKVGPTASRTSRYWLSAVHRGEGQDFISDIYNYGGITYSRQYSISYKKFANNLALLEVSGGTVGFGILQLFFRG